MKLNTIYCVHYVPNCEENYIIFVSFFKKNCELFIKKHSEPKSYYRKKYYNSYDLIINKYKLEHWYKI